MITHFYWGVTWLFFVVTGIYYTQHLLAYYIVSIIKERGGGEGCVIRGYYIYLFYIIFSVISTASMETVEAITTRWKILGCNQICKLIRISQDFPLVASFVRGYEKRVQKTFEHIARKTRMNLDYQTRYPLIPHNNPEFAKKARRVDLLLTIFFRRLQAVSQPERLLRRHTISSETVVYDQEQQDISVTLE